MTDNRSLGEAIERAVHELRGGDTLVISVELGTSWAELRDPIGYVSKSEFKGSLAEQINSATDWSIAHGESTGKQE